MGHMGSFAHHARRMESVQNNFPNHSSMKLKQVIQSIAIDLPKVVVRRLSAKFATIIPSLLIINGLSHTALYCYVLLIAISIWKSAIR